MEAPITRTCRRVGLLVLAIGATVPAWADDSGVASYLRARAAAADGHPVEAAAGLSTALAAVPDDAAIALQAYRAGLTAGDEPLVHRAALTLGGRDAPADLPLVALGDAARAGDLPAFSAATARLGGALDILVPSLRAWAAFVRGDAPVAPAAPADGVAAQLLTETDALLTIARGDVAAGIAAVHAAEDAGASRDVRTAAAELLAGGGHAKEAAAMLDGGAPAASSSAIRPTLAFATSRLLTRVAVSLSRDAPPDLTIALTRAALRADPLDDRARLPLASALARTGATDRALAVLDGVRGSTAVAATAVGGKVAILAAAHRDAEALAAAAASAERAGSVVADWQRYADRLVAARRYPEAAAWYRRVLDAGSPDDWAAWLQYGGALDNADDWRGAKRAVGRAVKLAPDEAVALNYLGYAKAERGEDLKGATRLLERASALRPDDLSISDSLGWTYYLRGDVARALPLVEKAARGDPTNAEIAEHLGDVYWTLGRRYEARYAWRAAALTAEAGAAARLAARLDTGLPAR